LFSQFAYSSHPVILIVQNVNPNQKRKMKNILSILTKLAREKSENVLRRLTKGACPWLVEGPQPG
jgi:hypothetical protein